MLRDEDDHVLSMWGGLLFVSRLFTSFCPFYASLAKDTMRVDRVYIYLSRHAGDDGVEMRPQISDL